MAEYYDRREAVHIDGTRIFATREDTVGERQVADWLARVWRCELRPFGALSPVDWYAIRDGRLIGICELKTRSHPVDKYPTVFLNVRKWLALRLGSVGLGVPALFVVRWPDDLRSISIDDLEVTRVVMGGAGRPRQRIRGNVTSTTDREPVIEVPVNDMRQWGVSSDDVDEDR